MDLKKNVEISIWDGLGDKREGRNIIILESQILKKFFQKYKKVKSYQC